MVRICEIRDFRNRDLKLGLGVVRCPALAVAAGSPEKAAQLANEDVRLSHANRLWAELGPLMTWS